MMTGPRENSLLAPSGATETADPLDRFVRGTACSCVDLLEGLRPF